jgi:glycosyltransferase involved in cell wall biosynthesis
LYNSQEELVEKLRTILATPGEHLDKRGELASHMEKYSWELVIDKYDKELEKLMV